MQHCHGRNKASRSPFHFTFCNVLPGGKIYTRLEKGCLIRDGEIITVTEKHYTEFYDKSRLVYLSPNAVKPMKNFSEDDVYIIGGLVDRAVEEPLTLARSKQEKLRTVRLPIDEHIRFVNQMFVIIVQLLCFVGLYIGKIALVSRLFWLLKAYRAADWFGEFCGLVPGSLNRLGCNANE